jgi:hypothetical protein
MSYSRSLGIAGVAAAALAVACSSDSNRAPERQTQTPEKALNQPATVAGCLRASMAENTFVLHEARSDGAFGTANYELIGTPGVELRDYANQEVEVSGTLRSQQVVASSGTTTETTPAGTAGIPAVKTRSEVDVRRLEVTSVKPTGKSCAEK